MICATVSQAQTNEPRWVGTWATAPEYTGKGDMPRTTNLSGCSLRQTVKVSLGGETLRLQLSNHFGSGAVGIKAVYIADALDSCNIDKRTVRYLTFNGKKPVTLEAGTTIWSDAVSYQLKPLQLLSITIVYETAPEHATSHRGSRTTSYIMSGVSKPSKPFVTSEHTDHWYNIAAIDVASDTKQSIAILGNSITDGRGSTTNAQNRWPDALAETLKGEVGVLNLGIGGNCLIKGGLSQPGRERFDRDILGQSGVNTIIIFEGINDIGGSNKEYEQVAQKLIDTYRELIDKGHQAGKKVYGATITPLGNSFYWSHFHEAVRQTVNEWIRTGKAFDGIIDFDALVHDPQQPQQLIEVYSDDWLHLNPAGYQAMGRFAAEQLK